MSRWKRAQAARRGWDTRIRREGLKQVSKAIISRYSWYPLVKLAKDLVVGTYKIFNPRMYRRNRIAKTIDKWL